MTTKSDFNRRVDEKHLLPSYKPGEEVPIQVRAESERSRKKNLRESRLIREVAAWVVLLMHQDALQNGEFPAWHRL